MRLLKLDPFSVHFGDPQLERDWRVNPIKNEALWNSIFLNGVIDPILVHLVDNQYKCWRGTERLRIARALGFNTINALFINEIPGVNANLSSEEVQRYFRKKIKVFVNQKLKLWDVIGVDEQKEGKRVEVY